MSRNLKMIVQIYEIQTPEEAARCIEVGVDHVGSILLPEAGWKNQALKETLGMTQGTPTKNTLIPLFREMDVLFRILDYYRPDVIHFCETLTDNRGSETELDPYVEAQSRIGERFPEVEIMRSIPIPAEDSTPGFPSLEVARKLEPVSDFFLTDTWMKNEPIQGFIGITGKPCDWKIAEELVLQSKIPVILAGGLSPENVHEALVKVRPAGADSCTQTNKRDKEGNPVRFKKDFERVKKFVQEIRRTESLIQQSDSARWEY
jgi:phosphoribosylanthranilate isomerase